MGTLKCTRFNVSYEFPSDPTKNVVLNSWGVGVAGYSNVVCTSVFTDNDQDEDYNRVRRVKHFVKKNELWNIIYSTVDSKTFDSSNNLDGVTCTSSYSLGSSETYYISAVGYDSKWKETRTGFISCNFEQYSPPIINNFSVKRTYNPNGQVIVYAGWSISSVGGRNSFKKAEIRYRRELEAWSEWLELDIVNDTTFLLDGSFPIFNNYDFEFRVYDQLTVSNSSYSIPIEQVVVDYKAGGDGFAIGKKCPSKGFHVAWDTVIDGNLSVLGKPLIDVIYPPGTVYLTTSSSVDPNIIFGGTWVAAGQQQSPSGGVMGYFWKRNS